MMHIRNMAFSDLAQASGILSKAFSKARAEEGYKSTYIPPPRLEYLQMYLAGFGDGCLVYEEKSKIRGFIMSHLWGQIGWIGPLAVQPNRQERGIGRLLLDAAVQRLKQSGAACIGLETMPRNYRNLTFYTRHGFVPGYLTVDLMRRIEDAPSMPPFAEFSLHIFSALPETEKPAFLQQADALAQGTDRLLRVSKEIEIVSGHGFGDAMLLLQHDRPIGFALAHTEKYYALESRHYVKVYLGALHPGSGEHEFGAFLHMLERWARRIGLKILVLRVSTRYHKAYHWLVKQNFYASHTDLRMTLAGYEEQAQPDRFYLNKWE